MLACRIIGGRLAQVNCNESYDKTETSEAELVVSSFFSGEKEITMVTLSQSTSTSVPVTLSHDSGKRGDTYPI